jgi:hypothetical protein
MKIKGKNAIRRRRQVVDEPAVDMKKTMGE